MGESIGSQFPYGTSAARKLDFSMVLSEVDENAFQQPLAFIEPPLSSPPQDVRMKIRLNAEERRQYEEVVQMLSDLTPSNKLFDYLILHEISPSVAGLLLLEIGARQVFLPNGVIYALIDVLPQKETESCLLHMMQNRVYPPFICQVDLLARRKYQFPLSHEVNRHIRSFLASTPLEDLVLSERYRQQLLCQAQQSLAEDACHSDALRQFRHYAFSIVQRHLRESSLRHTVMNEWLKNFIAEASAVSIDDGHDMKEVVSRAGIPKQYFDKDILALLDGTWQPEMRSVSGLQAAILQGRLTVWRQCELCVSPSLAIFKAVQTVRDLVASGTVRHTFSPARTTEEIERIQLLVTDGILYLASWALIAQTTRSLNDMSVPQLKREGQEAPPMWKVKAYPTPEGELSITLATPLKQGSYKTVWKVARIAGTPFPYNIVHQIYAYAKFDCLSQRRHLIRDLKRRAMIDGAEGKNITALREQIGRVQRSEARYQNYMMEGVRVVQELGDDIAIQMQTIAKKLFPSQIKGGAMVCMDGSLESLDTSRMTSQECLDVSHDVCRLVARMHDRGYVHLDVSGGNILYARTPSGVTVKLTDCDSARRYGDAEQLTGRTAAYASPEMRVAVLQHPIPLAPSADDWSLGMVLSRMSIPKKYLPELIEKDGSPTSACKIRRGLDRARKEAHPASVEVIRGLLRYNPGMRWTAHKAAQVLDKKRFCASRQHSQSPIPKKRQCSSAVASHVGGQDA
jgi:serine/threonine protein kinase